MMFSRPSPIDVRSGLNVLQPKAQLAYRQLRDRLQLARGSDSKPPRSVLVTSARRQEGATSTATYLSLAYAEQDTGRGTLVIDACAEGPQLHEIFAVSNTPGLSDLLLGRFDADAVTKQSIIPSVRVVPAGDAVLSLAMHRDTVQSFLVESAQEHDMTLIDAPAILESTTSELLASVVDGIVLVVHAQKTPQDVVCEATRRLNAAGGTVIGVVLHDYREFVPKILQKQLSV